ncbi:hypothetical protein IKQ21_06895 [bacterium]|nr:hypothetical protein [bacterium]
MFDKNTVNSIKNYFIKLRKIVTNGADLNLIKFKLIKRGKIDDTLCCIFALLPEPYKKALKEKRQKLTSIVAYNYLSSILTKKFPLGSEYYIVKTRDTLKYIDAIIQTIEKDIQWVETHDF